MIKKHVVGLLVNPPFLPDAQGATFCVHVIATANKKYLNRYLEHIKYNFSTKLKCQSAEQYYFATFH